MAAEDARLLCLNVLMNAIQHAPPSSKVEIAAAIAGNLLAIRVRDHGAGISEQDGPRLFEPFYRADPSRNRESGGTGLGLAICRAICVRNGGEISIANHPHGGAVVEIRLRACPPQVTAV
jgi:signal transduction histidine kinase